MSNPNEYVLIAKEVKHGSGFGICSVCKKKKMMDAISLSFKLDEKKRHYWVNICVDCLDILKK